MKWREGDYEYDCPPVATAECNREVTCTHLPTGASVTSRHYTTCGHNAARAYRILLDSLPSGVGGERPS